MCLHITTKVGRAGSVGAVCSSDRSAPCVFQWRQGVGGGSQGRVTSVIEQGTGWESDSPSGARKIDTRRLCEVR